MQVRKDSTTTTMEVQPEKHFSGLRAGTKAARESANVGLRSLGLAIVLPFNSWRGSEKPKIALRQSHSAAVARAAVHLAPVTACLVILSFNFRVVFIHYSPALAALQYVAKLHEMLMQASIAAIVFGCLRQCLVGDNTLPFGAILAGSQVQNLSTMFSLEFWGAVTSPSLGWRRKLILWVIIPLSIALAATVGPSTAILILPRAMQPHVGSDDIFLNEEALFPHHMTVETAGIP
jgi:hypothetical protein